MSNKYRAFFQGKQEFLVDFNAEKITTDAGALLIEKIEKKHRIIKYFSDLIPDKRDPSYITYSMEHLLKQRVMLNAQGYEDGNDVEQLKNDPLFEEILGQNLSSQPTVSRFENTVNKHVIFDLLYARVDRYVENFSPKRRHLVIDIDGTDAETYGHQQLSLFNGFYGHTMYNQLLFHDGQTGEVILPALRPGNAHSNWWYVAILERIIKKLRAKLPNLVIYVRADSGFSTPKFYNMAKNYNLLYVIGIASNQVLKRQTKLLSEIISSICSKDKKKLQYFSKTFDYQANTWQQPEQCFAKVEYTGKGMNIRYIISNIRNLTNQDIYKEFYVQRGETSENRIKDLKTMCYSDRMSNSDFWSNFFRLIMSSMTYEFFRLIKLKINSLELDKFNKQKKWNINSIRLLLLKAGAMIKKTKRRVKISISNAFAYKDLFVCLLQ